MELVSYEMVCSCWKQQEGCPTQASRNIKDQRGGAAIAREVRREGVECEDSDGYEWVESWYERYPDNEKFLNSCKASTRIGKRRLPTPFGRLRHFHEVDDEVVQAGQEREACNFPIQSTVSDALSLALIFIGEERAKRGMTFKIVHAIHDAVLLEVPYHEVKGALEVLKVAMCERLEVPGCGLHYGIDCKVSERWGDKGHPELLRKCGIEKT